ncbi:MAG TPA: Calx-beta domain-containing protein [Thermoanaerobaculia bacterium]|nr:Calx-beta domain-containing protein [Thermoanaerobaculia bacterium]
MKHRLVLPALALGLLLATAIAVPAMAQHHGMGAMSAMGAKEYDEPDPRGGDPNPPAGCSGVQAKITIGGNSTSFSPARLTVDVGQPVCWTWARTSSEHSVKADDASFTSGNPSTEGTFQHTYDAPGTYGFYCLVHGSPTGGMRGTVVVRGTSGGGGSGQGGGKLELAPAYTVSEGAGTLAVTVERTGGSDGAATVKISTANGTAKPGKDFTTRNATLKWVSGDQDPKTFEVPIKNDTAQEQDETFTIKLSKATGAALGTSSAMVTVHDDDGAGCGAGAAVPAQLRAAGQSASEIRLTWADDSAAASAFRIERRQPGGAFQEIAAVAAGAGSFTDSGLPGGAIFQYRIRAEGLDGVSPFSAIAAGATDGESTACDETRALCLHGGRFEATVQWRPSEADAANASETGREAKRIRLSEAPDRRGGLFSFSPQDDPGLLLNVFDGCAVNGHYGLDLAAVTDVELTVKVRDTRTGRTWVYFNPEGSAPAPVHDVDAFAACH